ncbi:MAG: glutamate racemase [Spirochaetota bacterium]
MSIAFIDSGIGGIPYVLKAREYLPAERFTYVADTASFPYGERSPDFVIRSVSSITEKLIEAFSPRVIVIACNTASVFALPILRERFHVPFVGTVPAIKPAAEVTRSGRIGVLATSRTVGAAYLDELVDEHATECVIERFAGSQLVDFVESGGWNAPAADVERALRPTVEVLKTHDIDTLVLGCTHFIFLQAHLETLLGSGISVVDSRDGVARRILSLAGSDGESRPERVMQPRDLLYTTGFSPQYEKLAGHFGFSYAGTLHGKSGQ